MGLSIFSSIFMCAATGVVVRYTRHLKPLILIGFAINILGLGLMIRFRGTENSQGELAMSQVIRGLGVGMIGFPIQAAVQSMTRHERECWFLPCLQVNEFWRCMFYMDRRRCYHLIVSRHLLPIRWYRIFYRVRAVTLPPFFISSTNVRLRSYQRSYLDQFAREAISCISWRRNSGSISLRQSIWLYFGESWYKFNRANRDFSSL